MQGVLGERGEATCFGDFSGVFVSGLMSTVSKGDNLVLSSEDSSCPDESELELGLGLSLPSCLKSQPVSTGQYPRILTAKDFPSRVASFAPSSSTSSNSNHSSTLSRANHVSYVRKRASDSVAGANGLSQIVGWPPIRAYRMNSLNNNAKSSTTEAFNSMGHKCKSEDGESRMTNCDKNKSDVKEKINIRNSYFVKVNIDGFSIGRKVNMSAHSCYDTLARILKEMFHLPTEVIIAERYDGHDMIVVAQRQSKLNESSEFVLTYEDKDGDWMLAGDVPWGMFINSVRRLRIMRNAGAKGLGMRTCC